MNNKERRDLAIIQQNVRGRDIENDGLWSMQDYIEMAKEIKYKCPDIVFLTEFYYKKMYAVTQKLFDEYEFIKPLGMSEADEKQSGLFATCVLAIKRNKVIKKKQIKLNNMLDFRYICIELMIGKRKMKMLLMYIPQTLNANNKRIEQKKKMLDSAREYILKNCDNILFVGGDMNSDIDKKTTTCISNFNQIYEMMIDTDCEKKATWKDKRLDYALVSGIERDRVKTVPFKTKSDHKGLITEFYEKSEKSI